MYCSNTENEISSFLLIVFKVYFVDDFGLGTFDCSVSDNSDEIVDFFDDFRV
jgi:hypothetical protein